MISWVTNFWLWYIYRYIWIQKIFRCGFEVIKRIFISNIGWNSRSTLMICSYHDGRADFFFKVKVIVQILRITTPIPRILSWILRIVYQVFWHFYVFNFVSRITFIFLFCFHGKYKHFCYVFLTYKKVIVLLILWQANVKMLRK